MKKIIQLKCANCGADLKIEEKREVIYCQYCGTKMLLDDENEHTYRYIDEAEIKRAETEQMVKSKELELKEKRQEENKKKAKMNGYKCLLLVVGCVLLLTLPLFYEKRASSKQEEELQQIVNEVKLDVQNEKFEDSYLRAKSIQYTANWSSEIKEKWDNIRKEIRDYVIQKEKEVTGKSKHKPEKNVFLSNLFQ